MFKKRRIYLDYASTTPVDHRVLRSMSKMQSLYGNPSSLHQEGVQAKKSLEEARIAIARLFQVKSEEVFFTASGTESNNLAIRGIVAGYTGSDIPHIVTSVIEHPAILEVCKHLEKEHKAEVTYVEVNKDGLVSSQEVCKALKKNTVLVSVMLVNNEIGTIQPIPQISRCIERYRKEHKSVYPYLHTDASQAPCYVDCQIQRLGVDMMSIDGIKVYGPRGTGVLIKKTKVAITPIFLGGGQEKGIRPGTENVVAIVGLAQALKIAEEEREMEVARLQKLRDLCNELVLKQFPDASINGSLEKRVANNSNICFPGIDTEFLVITLDAKGIAVSFSSSCRSRAENASSYVVEALKKDTCTHSSLRITLGRYTTRKDIRRFVRELSSAVSLVARK